MSTTTTPLYYEIPISNPPQIIQITLAGNPLTLTFSYRDSPIGMGGWVMDMGDGGNAPILCGVPLVTGADLLAQYEYLEFGGALIVQSDGVPDDMPTFWNLGQVPGGHLYWIPALGSPSP